MRGARGNRWAMNSLVLAAIPAFLGSLFLMYRGDAPPSQMLQQVLVFGLCATLCVALSRRPLALTEATQNGLLIGAVLALLAPLVLMSGDGPRRWIGLGGFRLYTAAVVLPSLLLLLAQMVGTDAIRRILPRIVILMTVTALALQPDTAQATAFSLACLVFLPQVSSSRLIRMGMGVALAGMTFAAWLRPDLLQPVSYVEGVLQLALAFSPLALLVALFAMALPVFQLYRLSRTSPYRSGFLALVLYYTTLMYFAYRQITPMPFLGFGIGPILGYFAMATLVTWKK